jgi:hypothetical protein
MAAEGRKVAIFDQRGAIPEPTREQSPVYTTSELTRELRQGEIISNLVQHVFDAGKGILAESLHPLVIVLSQDCDLAQDFDTRQAVNPRPHLNGVLLYEVRSADDFRRETPARDLRNPAIKNQIERFHFLESVPPSLDVVATGLTEMIIDFKRFFTVSPTEVYRQFTLKSQDSAKRRCRLEMPYREHLQARAAYYFQ